LEEGRLLINEFCEEGKGEERVKADMNGDCKERVEAPNEGQLDGSRRHDKGRKDAERVRRIKSRRRK